MVDKYVARNTTSGEYTEVYGTVAGGTAVQAGQILALDSTGRIDPTVLPTGLAADVASLTALSAYTAGDVVTVTATGFQRASAATTGTKVDGFVLSAGAVGSTALVYFEGRNTSATGPAGAALVPGTDYFLSDTTPGGLVAVPVTGAGKRHQYVGRAITATSLNFEPDQPLVLA